MLFTRSDVLFLKNNLCHTGWLCKQALASCKPIQSHKFEISSVCMPLDGERAFVWSERTEITLYNRWCNAVLQTAGTHSVCFLTKRMYSPHYLPDLPNKGSTLLHDAPVFWYRFFLAASLSPSWMRMTREPTRWKRSWDRGLRLSTENSITELKPILLAWIYSKRIYVHIAALALSAVFSHKWDRYTGEPYAQ